jgi:hypothetical protein
VETIWITYLLAFSLETAEGRGDYQGQLIEEVPHFVVDGKVEAVSRNMAHASLEENLAGATFNVVPVSLYVSIVDWEHESQIRVHVRAA